MITPTAPAIAMMTPTAPATAMMTLTAPARGGQGRAEGGQAV